RGGERHLRDSGAGGRWPLGSVGTTARRSSPGACPAAALRGPHAASPHGPQRAGQDHGAVQLASQRTGADQAVSERWVVTVRPHCRARSATTCSCPASPTRAVASSYGAGASARFVQVVEPFADPALGIVRIPAS